MGLGVVVRLGYRAMGSIGVRVAHRWLMWRLEVGRMEEESGKN